MRVIGYTSERLAAAYCLRCANRRWFATELEAGKENANGQHNLHPIFSTDNDEHTCDDCFEGVN